MKEAAMATDEGTVHAPLPNNTRKVEPKTKWGAIAAYLGTAALLAAVEIFTNDQELLVAVLPDAVEVFVLPLVPAIVSLAAAYKAKHQYRSAEVEG
jgi:hypothetical protein